MAEIKINGPNDAAVDLLAAWGMTASSVADGEAKIKARTIKWYLEEIERGKREAHENSFDHTPPEWT